MALVITITQSNSPNTWTSKTLPSGGLASAAALVAETARATAAEGVNATAISAETTRATAAEALKATAAALATETTRATAAEGTNATNIANEITRATTVEASKASSAALTAETTRATTAEATAQSTANAAGTAAATAQSTASSAATAAAAAQTTANAAAVKAANGSDFADAGSTRANLHVPVLTSCQAVATGNITLSGTQTIDGYAALAGDQILCAGQTAGSQNGPWLVAAGGWTRPTDYASGLVVKGRSVQVNGGSPANVGLWVMATITAVTVDTTATTWNMAGSGTYALVAEPIGTAAQASANTALTEIAALPSPVAMALVFGRR
jgi:hypothetical protein